MSVDPETGLLLDCDGRWTNWEPIELDAGNTISLTNEQYQLRIWGYSAQSDESLSHEYSYDAESNWTRLDPALSSNKWVEAPWVVDRPCFIRISVRRKAEAEPADALADNNDMPLGRVIDIEPAQAPHHALAACLKTEVEYTARRAASQFEAEDFAFLLLSDIHYSTGCIWPETALGIQETAARLPLDAIVQLGDISDGIAPVPVTLSFTERILGDLNRCGVPVLCCVGNHDTNYFKGNSDRLSLRDAALLYTGRDELWYFEDFPAKKMRCIFLSSFDPARSQRYGFGHAQITWLKKTLEELPEGYRVLVFSHVPPLPEIHYWSDTILNGPKLLRILERFNRRHPGTVLGFIHGHNHVDQIYWKQSFPIVSIGCAKLEDFEECKPAGSYTPKRVRGTRTQELWDIVIVKGNEPRLEFVRFGAGEDRSATVRDTAR